MKLAPLFAGAAPAAAATYQTAAEVFAANPGNAEYQAQIRSFREEGLQEAGSQHLKIAGTADAIITVLAFSSADGAGRAVAALPESGGQESRFAISGVPGAVGSESLSSGQATSRNVFFQVGAYAYILGFASSSPSEQQPSQEVMASAASNWYAKVRLLR